MKRTVVKKECLSSLAVGNYLRCALKKKGISRQKFAIDMYVDVRTVGRWINDGVNQLDVIQEIADYFNVNAGDILFSVTDGEEDVPFLPDRTFYAISGSFFLL